MINRDKNPEFLNSFLDYSITILNKSPNSVKEYNYDLNMFLKYMMIEFKDTNEKDFDKIDISNFSVYTFKKINLNSDGIKEDTNTKIDVKLLNYDKEEAFLVALKQLQQNLSN